MKNSGNIRELLGITQTQMAMLLKINRAQWSMYESGKRSLPLEASLLLTKMLVHLQTLKDDDSEKIPHAATQQNKNKKEFESLLKENQFQLLLTAQKAATAKKKYEAHVKALQLAGYLGSEPEFKTGLDTMLLNEIEAKAKKGIEQNGLHIVKKLQLKLDVLHQEELLLRAALGK